ncbi:MAG: hypothetical protein ISR65_12570 [Bacteriovoracaceae bacterium]|nr:hypothetical protein [Bacteriovoracaceae bacterium]
MSSIIVSIFATTLRSEKVVIFFIWKLLRRMFRPHDLFIKKTVIYNIALNVFNSSFDQSISCLSSDLCTQAVYQLEEYSGTTDKHFLNP